MFDSQIDSRWYLGSQANSVCVKHGKTGLFDYRAELPSCFTAHLATFLTCDSSVRAVHKKQICETIIINMYLCIREVYRTFLTM